MGRYQGSFDASNLFFPINNGVHSTTEWCSYSRSGSFIQMPLIMRLATIANCAKNHKMSPASSASTL